jgi:putative transposase
MELAAQYPAYGHPMLHDILCQTWPTPINHKRTARIYRLEELSLRRRNKRRRFRHLRKAQPQASSRDEVWSMDFIHDWLGTNQRFKVLTIVDHCTRELPDLHSDTSIRGKDVVSCLERLRLQGRKPRVIIMDNGPEFRSKALHKWATKHGVQLHFIEPGKPVQNAYIESFNGRFREECLDRNLFENLDHARLFIAAWKREYETVRPHSGLGGLTPKAFVERLTA